MERKLPAYPIFTKDPNFSLWSVTDVLNESNLQSWYGKEKRVYGFVKVNGEVYCFLGNATDFSACGVKKAEQTAVEVKAFSTDYQFKAGEAIVNLRFISPLPLDDLDTLSMPVCYMQYEIVGVEQAEISLFLHRENAYNDLNTDKRVRGGVIPCDGFEASFLGLQRQLPLSNNDDLIGADWGYFYVAGERGYFLDEKDLNAYLVGGLTDFSHQTEERYIGAMHTKTTGAFVVAYDETVAIDYFGEYKKGWYLSTHTIMDALREGVQNRAELVKKLDEFDSRLKERSLRFGESYYALLTASLRQAISGHKLVKDEKGEVLFLSKENGSNGCIATVDVSYPSMPLFLLYNTELVKGMLRPIFKFARMPVWKYDFAPHDAGTYPACCGQVYGLNAPTTRYHGDYFKGDFCQTHFPVYLLPAEFDAYDYNLQMPVEECANAMIMLFACFVQDGDVRFFAENKDLCEKWVSYLVRYGLKPENQLCTDDFAGHLTNNINLAIKATVGIASYAELVKADGDLKAYEEYRAIAEKYAKEIETFGWQYAHLPLTWETDDTTYSLKYNLAFDKILKLNLFSQELLEREVDFYLTKMKKYGVPLDNRKDYTKSDWLIWCACLTNDKKRSTLFVESLQLFLKTSPERLPFTDWFETESGEYHGFRARTTQGGCFILLLL